MFDNKLQQGVPAQSSAVAEYRAITRACNALIWLRSCLKELNMELEEPVLFREDNQAAIAAINMSTNFMTTKRTKHVDIQHHIIRYRCRKDVMDFAYVDTDNQLADMMHKILTHPPFRIHRAQCMSNEHVKDDNNPFVPS